MYVVQTLLLNYWQFLIDKRSIHPCWTDERNGGWFVRATDSWTYGNSRWEGVAWWGHFDVSEEGLPCYCLVLIPFHSIIPNYHFALFPTNLLLWILRCASSLSIVGSSITPHHFPPNRCHRPLPNRTVLHRCPCRLRYRIHYKIWPNPWPNHYEIRSMETNRCRQCQITTRGIGWIDGDRAEGFGGGFRSSGIGWGGECEYDEVWEGEYGDFVY